jgi:hypothetical protein
MIDSNSEDSIDSELVPVAFLLQICKLDHKANKYRSKKKQKQKKIHPLLLYLSTHLSIVSSTSFELNMFRP